MERLSDNAIDIINQLHTERLNYISEYIPLIDAANRLSDYEDTGLTPEEITELKSVKSWAESVEHELEKYMQLEKDGRLMVLPCKVGATVWAITSPVNVPGMDSEEEQLAIFECSVESISLYASTGTQFRLYYHGEFVAWHVTAADFGKTVFLTREEAETALKEREG